jgi:hypothetical protein
VQRESIPTRDRNERDLSVTGAYIFWTVAELCTH